MHFRYLSLAIAHEHQLNGSARAPGNIAAPSAATAQRGVFGGFQRLRQPSQQREAASEPLGKNLDRAARQTNDNGDEEKDDGKDLSRRDHATLLGRNRRPQPGPAADQGFLGQEQLGPVSAQLSPKAVVVPGAALANSAVARTDRKGKIETSGYREAAGPAV